jgi:hypothetical protein
MSKFPDMMSLGEFLVQKTKETNLKFPYSNNIVSGNFDSEKVDQDEVFYYKDTLHFFLE